MKQLSLYCLILTLSLTAQGRVLHSEKSLYRNIIVEEVPGKRCMVFGRLSKYPDYQSCINPNKPKYLVFSYTKLILAGLSLMPNPRSILIIGLGGGTLPLRLAELYPESKIDTVEIDDAVVRVARKWFSYKDSENQKIHIVDGRVFVKRQIRKQTSYDLIILDAFNGDYIPEHLMTKEFISEAKQLLKPSGLLIANTFSNNKLYDHESVTYQQVFSNFKYIHSKMSGNRIIYASTGSNSSTITPDIINQLKNIGVKVDELNKQIRTVPDWDQTVRPLTDQYSPANLLNQ